MLIGKRDETAVFEFEERTVEIPHSVFEQFVDDLRQKVITRIDGVSESEHAELLLNLLPKLFPSGTMGISENTMSLLLMAQNSEMLEKLKGVI